MKTLYQTLGIKKKATKDEIRAAFKTLAKKLHSDVGGHDSAFIEIKRAHDVLMDDAARDQYDRYGLVPGDPESIVTQAAASELRGLFMAVVQSNSLEAILKTDIVAKMRETIAANLNRITQQIADIDSKTSSTERLRKELISRLKCKAKRAPEVMLAALDSLIEQLPAQKAMAEQALVKVSKMAELLQDYSFDFDAPPPRIVHFGGFTTTTTAGW